MGMILSRTFTLVALAGISAVLLAYMVMSGAGQPRFPDEQEYLDLARALVSHGQFAWPDGTITAGRPLGYALILVPFIALGLGAQGVIVAQVLMWAGAAWLLGRVVARAYGAGAGAFATLLCLINPGTAGSTMLLFPQTAIGFFLVLSLYLAACDAYRLSWRGGLTQGLVWAALILLNPLLVGLGGVIILVLALRRGDPGAGGLTLGGRAAALAISLLVMAAPTTLWMARNYVTVGVFAPATNSGTNLALGNGPDVDLDQGMANTKVIDETLYAGMSEAGRDAAIRAKVMAWIIANPLDAARQYGYKLVSFFRIWDDLTYSSAATKAVMTVYGGYFALLAGLGLIGALVFLPRLGMISLLTVLIVAYFDAAYSVFFVRIRFRMPIDYALAAHGAAIAALAAAWLREKRTRTG